VRLFVGPNNNRFALKGEIEMTASENTSNDHEQIPGLDTRESIRSRLRVIRLGLSVSAVLALLYVLVMIPSLLLGGLFYRFLAGSLLGHRVEHLGRV
jgi:hypothetical protein